VLCAYKAKSAHQIDNVTSILVYEAEAAGKDSQWGNSSVTGEWGMDGKGWNVDLNEVGLCYTTVFIMNK
jgi:hypothetical protein